MRERNTHRDVMSGDTTITTFKSTIYAMKENWTLATNLSPKISLSVAKT